MKHFHFLVLLLSITTTISTNYDQTILQNKETELRQFLTKTAQAQFQVLMAAYQNLKPQAPLIPIDDRSKRPQVKLVPPVK